LNGGEERRGPLGVTGGNPTPAFKVQHGVLHQMTKLIEILVIVSLDKAVLLRRNDWYHFLPGRLLENGVGVIAAIGQQVFGGYPLNESASLCAIRSGTCCNKDSDRQTKRIHGQMYFGVEPPFVMFMASLPPGAPAA
jgi:hypothetical protein